MGASTVYHLASRGYKDVLLLEREKFFGTGATGRCAGGIRYQFNTEVNIRLSQKSLPMIDAFLGKPDVDFSIELITNSSGTTSGCAGTEKLFAFQKQNVFVAAACQMINSACTHDSTSENYYRGSFWQSGHFLYRDNCSEIFTLCVFQSNPGRDRILYGYSTGFKKCQLFR